MSTQSVAAASSSNLEVPSSVLQRLASFQTAFNEAEDLLKLEMQNSPYEEHIKRAPLDRARVDLLWLYAGNCLLNLSLNMKGKRADQFEPLKAELERAKKNFARQKMIEDKATLMPRLDKGAAGRFVRNATWDTDADNKHDEQNTSMPVDQPELSAAETLKRTITETDTNKHDTKPKKKRNR